MQLDDSNDDDVSRVRGEQVEPTETELDCLRNTFIDKEKNIFGPFHEAFQLTNALTFIAETRQTDQWHHLLAISCNEHGGCSSYASFAAKVQHKEAVKLVYLVLTIDVHGEGKEQNQLSVEST